MTESNPTTPKLKLRWFQYSLRKLLLVTTFIAVLLGLFSYWVQWARDQGLAAASQCPLNQLQLALTNYHATHGCFPPAYIADKDGKPMHSWRVLILPFIEEDALYKAYDFNEPWNGPHNSKLATRMPSIFHIRSEPPSDGTTNIVVITGPDTAFPGATPTSLKDFRDGGGSTILLAEIAHSDINWLEPRDLRAEEMSFTVNDKTKPSISCSRRKGPYVVFADSIHTHWLSPSLRPETLRALTTIDGAEEVAMANVDKMGLVNLVEGPVTDEALSRFSPGDGVNSLWLIRSKITDLGLEHLKGLSQLQVLHLDGASVTDAGVKKLQQALPNCTIEWKPPTPPAR